MSDKSINLYLAILANDIEQVKLQIKLGADLEFIPGYQINITANYKLTPLQKAISMGQPDIAKVLMDAGADIHNNGESKRGLVEIAYASKNTSNILSELVSLGCVIPDHMKDKVNRRLNPYVQPDDANHRLYAAVRANDLDGVNKELENGGDVEFIPPLDIKGMNTLVKTPLQVAISSGFTQVALKLIEAGADIDSNGKTTKTPLDFCLFSTNMPDVVAILLDRGATLKAFAGHHLNQYLALYLPHRLSEADRDALRVENETKKELTPLKSVIDSIKSGRIDHNYFWENLKKVSHREILEVDSLNMLQYFCRNYMVDHYGTSGYKNENMIDDDLEEMTDWDCIHAILTLVDSGLDVNSADRKGWTPLLFASRNIYLASGSAVPAFLVGLGADIHAKTVRGKLASDYISFEESQLILDEMMNQDGETDYFSEHVIQEADNGRKPGSW